MQLASELKPIDLNEFIEIAKDCTADHIYLHWTAGHYGQIYSDYHISIDYDGRIYLPDNCTDLNQYRQHTWMRNSNAVGIALCCCYGAIANSGYDADLGDEPVTSAQIEALSAVVAILCKYANIPVENVLTHCEAALADGYGPYQSDPDLRWDLWWLPDINNTMLLGGDVIRGKARWYMNYY